MGDFDSPFVVATDPFVDAYIETIESLAMCGYLFPYKERIPIFKVYTELQKQEQTDEVVDALAKLDVLKDLMVRGFEPEHNNNVYT